MLVDNRIKEFIEKKIGSLAKIIPKSEIIPVDVEIEKNQNHQKGDIYKVVVQFLLKGGKLIRAVEKKETFRLAISKVKDELEVQVKKYDHKPESQRKKALKISTE
ncbi:HPF/RaiA family ribosome-associated protein [bacterium]|nr:HPF/RaiA family ribosome-associated protein [bacterium]